MGISQGVPGSPGPFGGINPPKFITGQTYLPFNMHVTGVTITTTVNDLFYYPFYCWKTQTFAGAKTYNQGAGDNTELIRLGLYADDGTTGGPGTLVKDFGAITLTGAAALRTLASSVTLKGQTWYWMAYAAQTAAAMFGMGQYVTSVGGAPTPAMGAATGFTLATAPSATASINAPLGLWVSTAYGAMAATAVAPTAEASGNTVASIASIAVPLMGLYV